MKKTELSGKFMKEYRANIILRCLCSLAIMAVAAGSTLYVDFSSVKYPSMAAVMILAAGFAVSCLLFRIHVIILKGDWSGTITDIDVGMKIKARGRRGRPVRLLIVTLKIKKENGSDMEYELYEKGSKKEIANKFQYEAPYKVGDTVVYLRGMKYPFRYGIEYGSDMFDVKTVCPFCGEINKAERDKCFKCGRVNIK